MHLSCKTLDFNTPLTVFLCCCCFNFHTNTVLTVKVIDWVVHQKGIVLKDCLSRAMVKQNNFETNFQMMNCLSAKPSYC